MAPPLPPVGDAVASVLRDPGAFRRFVSLLMLLIVLLVGGVGIGVPYLGNRLGLEATVLEISRNPRVILERRSGQDSEYVLAIHPQGWNATGIRIERGDSVEILAHGRVNISVNGVTESTRVRHEVENRLRREYREANGGAEPDTSWVPERHYTEADRRAVRPSRLWTGPEGYPGGVTDHRYPRRTRSKILPGAAYGLLVGAVSTKEPVRPNGFAGAFSVGEEHTIQSWDGPAGDLWLIVNDVWDDEDREFPDKFFIDNIGYYVVSVRVRKG